MLPYNFGQLAHDSQQKILEDLSSIPDLRRRPVSDMIKTLHGNNVASPISKAQLLSAVNEYLQYEATAMARSTMVSINSLDNDTLADAMARIHYPEDPAYVVECLSGSGSSKTVQDIYKTLPVDHLMVLRYHIFKDFIMVASWSVTPVSNMK